jgi:hypothetical protein
MLLCNAGQFACAPRLSLECKAFVINRLLQSIPPNAIIQQWRRQMHEDYALKNGLQSAAAAERVKSQVIQTDLDTSHSKRMLRNSSKKVIDAGNSYKKLPYKLLLQLFSNSLYSLFDGTESLNTRLNAFASLEKDGLLCM